MLGGGMPGKGGDLTLATEENLIECKEEKDHDS